MDGANLMGGIGAAGITAIIIFLLLLAILWFVMPFAIFGTKPILRKKLETENAILIELRAIRSLLEKQNFGNGEADPKSSELTAERL